MDNSTVTVILIGLIVFLIIYLFSHGNNAKRRPPRPRGESPPPTDWISSPHPSGKYGDATPTKRLKELWDDLGPASMVDARSGGLAIWYKRDLNDSSDGRCFEEIMVRDEYILHGHPKTHADFLYTQYKFCVPEDLVADVRDLSTSITYDPLKCWIRARCDSLAANAATLFLAKKIATREISGEEAKSEYGKQIKKSVSDPTAYEKMLEYLCEK